MTHPVLVAIQFFTKVAMGLAPGLVVVLACWWRAHAHREQPYD